MFLKNSLKSNFRNSFFPVIAVLMLGCAPVKVKMNKDYWSSQSNKKAKIGIGFATPPQGGVYREGGEGLLDMAINNAASSGINHYLQSFSLSKFNEIQKTAADSLKKAGMSYKLLGEEIKLDSLEKFKKPETAMGEYANLDFSSLIQKEGIDQLFLVSVHRFGTVRKYYGFIPLGAPKATIFATGQLIRLKDHQVLWRDDVNEIVEINGDWDQDPEYPNLSSALNAAMDTASKKLLSSFLSTE